MSRSTVRQRARMSPHLPGTRAGTRAGGHPSAACPRSAAARGGAAAAAAAARRGLRGSGTTHAIPAAAHMYRMPSAGRVADKERRRRLSDRGTMPSAATACFAAHRGHAGGAAHLKPPSCIQPTPHWPVKKYMSSMKLLGARCAVAKCASTARASAHSPPSPPPLRRRQAYSASAVPPAAASESDMARGAQAPAEGPAGGAVWWRQRRRRRRRQGATSRGRRQAGGVIPTCPESPLADQSPRVEVRTLEKRARRLARAPGAWDSAVSA